MCKYSLTLDDKVKPMNEETEPDQQSYCEQYLAEKISHIEKLLKMCEKQEEVMEGELEEIKNEVSTLLDEGEPVLLSDNKRLVNSRG